MIRYKPSQVTRLLNTNFRKWEAATGEYRTCVENNEALEVFVSICPAFAGIRARYWLLDVITSLNWFQHTELGKLIGYSKNTEFFR